MDPLLPCAVRLDQAQVAAIGEQGGVVFVVGMEQGRMRRWYEERSRKVGVPGGAGRRHMSPV